MSEENRREAELNERDLKNVSGGRSVSPALVAERAISVCCLCHFASRCSHKQEDIKAYLMEHGVDSIRFPMHCPYFNEF